MSDQWDDCEDNWDDYWDEGHSVEIQCPECDGSGQVTLDVTPSGRLMTDCLECGGTGWY